MTMSTRKSSRNNAGTMTAAARHAYEGKVGLEAMSRAGRNPHLKGIVHEVLVKDAHNANPANILSGKVASLTKSTNAIRDDIIVKQGGKIVERMQLKDTISTSGLAKTARQAASGKYAGTKLVGTKETTEAFKAASKATQKMSSSGVSSQDTARIATQTIGNSAGKLTASAVAKAAAASGAVGAAISGGIEAIHSGYKWANGEIDGEEFACNVAKEAVGGGLAAGAATAAGSVVTTVTATALAATTAPAWVPAAVGVGTVFAVGTAVKSVYDNIFA